MINYEKLVKTLHNVGLNPKEANIYLTCIRIGEQPASVISRLTKIKRTTVYDTLNSLIKKGIAHKIDNGGTTYFSVLNPNDLVKYIESEKKEILYVYDQKISSMQTIVNELNTLKSSKPTRPMVKYYEGEKGLREAYEDTLKSSEDIRAYANIKEMHDGLPHFFPEYYKRRSDSGIFIHTICPDNKESLERSKLDSKEMREIRFIDMNKYEFTPEINIYDNKVLFASWTEKMAVVIESHEIADFQKKVFDVLYEKLKK